MCLLKRLLLVLRHNVRESNGTLFIKSNRLGDILGVTPREAGVRMSYICKTDDIPMTVTTWSYTGGSRTWCVTIDDAAQLQRYITDLTDEPALKDGPVPTEVRST